MGFAKGRMGVGGVGWGQEVRLGKNAFWDHNNKDIVTYQVSEDGPTREVYLVEMWSRENPLVVSTQLSEGALRSKEAEKRQPCHHLLLRSL